MKRNYRQWAKMANEYRYWGFIAGLIGGYTYTLYRAKSSKNELFRMGAAGSLSMLICDVSLYSFESINAKQKVLVGENVGFKEMA